MNDIRVYSIRTYEKQILHDYYCQIVTHGVCDFGTKKLTLLGRYESLSNLGGKSNCLLQEPKPLPLRGEEFYKKGHF
jgi:hypothetical protein